MLTFVLHLLSFYCLLFASDVEDVMCLKNAPTCFLSTFCLSNQTSKI